MGRGLCGLKMLHSITGTGEATAGDKPSMQAQQKATKLKGSFHTRETIDVKFVNVYFDVQAGAADLPSVMEMFVQPRVKCRKVAREPVLQPFA